MIAISKDYYVDDLGNIYSKKSGVIKKMKPSLNGCGYLVVSINIDGKTKEWSVHRLIAQLFLDKKCDKMEVNHKDGNRSNNNINNLEWCTHSENIKHARDNNKNNKVCKINMEIANNIRNKYNSGNITMKKLSKEFNVGETTIFNVVRNKKWT